MPTSAESLTITSSNEDRTSAVSSCISQLLNEKPDMDRDQAVAICTDMADKAMGTRQSESRQNS